MLFARRAEKLKEVQEQCPSPDHVLAVEGDVSNEKDVVRLFEEAVKRFGMFAIYDSQEYAFSPASIDFLQVVLI